jgi:hypothetical protein
MSESRKGTVGRDLLIEERNMSLFILEDTKSVSTKHQASLVPLCVWGIGCLNASDNPLIPSQFHVLRQQMRINALFLFPCLFPPSFPFLSCQSNLA